MGSSVAITTAPNVNSHPHERRIEMTSVSNPHGLQRNDKVGMHFYRIVMARPTADWCALCFRPLDHQSHSLASGRRANEG